MPGVQINRFCASGLDAVNFAAAQVMSGQQDMAIGGGVESNLERKSAGGFNMSTVVTFSEMVFSSANR